MTGAGGRLTPADEQMLVDGLDLLRPWKEGAGTGRIDQLRKLVTSGRLQIVAAPGPPAPHVTPDSSPTGTEPA